jgi:hypothetical protein
MTRFGPATLALTFAYKVLHVAGAWLSAFMAAKIFQDKYIEQVYMKKGDPPPLAGMLATFMMLHILFSGVVFMMVSVLAYLVMHEDRPMLIKRSLIVGLDLGCEMIGTLIMGTVIANIMTNKRYYSYRYEGLRCIRAFREVLVVLTAVNGLTPYFLAAPDSWR